MDVPINQRNDIGLSDQELVMMSTKDLNRYVTFLEFSPPYLFLGSRGKSLRIVGDHLNFVRFISNFLCMCSNSMDSAHVILK